MAGQEEERWPVLTVLKQRHSDEPGKPISWDLIDEAQAPEFRDPVATDFSVEPYYPESHPAVLSPEEARLLIAMYDEDAGIHWAEELGEVMNRLEIYGKEHHADR